MDSQFARSPVAFFGDGFHRGHSPTLFATHPHSPTMRSPSRSADHDAWAFDQHLAPPGNSFLGSHSQYSASSTRSLSDLGMDLEAEMDRMDPAADAMWTRIEIGAPSANGAMAGPHDDGEHDLVDDVTDWVQVVRPRRSGSFLRSSDGDDHSSPAGLTPQSAGPSGDNLSLTVHMDISRAFSSGRTSTSASPTRDTPQGSSASSKSNAIPPSALPAAMRQDTDNIAQLGPCSKVWALPPRIRRRKKVKPADPATGKPSTKRQRESRDSPNARDGPKRRGAYTDETKKRNTALTRILKSCIRCRMNRGRCNPDESDPYGPCLTCKSITGPTLCKMPCYRYIITDASLYREQRAPYQVYSRRWQSMDIIDIPKSDWASPEIRTIIVSPNHLDAPFQFAVRKFLPIDGDLLEEQWMTPSGQKKTVPVPPFAVADMHATAADMKEYVERNISHFIAKAIGNEDPLLWETYTEAFRHIGSANTPEERSLLSNTFRLWVICRLISNPVHICGDEKLGGTAVQSEDSLHDGKVPMPMIMTAQFECINYTTFLRPWSKAVLKQLNELVLAKRRDYWITIYYAMFVLLHSCAMMTRRDEETARQYDMKTRYANPESIRAHHSGAQTMLAHFHFINKGVIPFSLPHNAAGKQELAKAANLTDEQVDFVWRTARLAHDPKRVARMRYVRERGLVGDDLYWVSMLFDQKWVPHGND